MNRIRGNDDLDSWLGDKSDAIVRYTLAEDNKQIFASKDMLYLPTEQELKNEIYAVIGVGKGIGGEKRLRSWKKI
jgi:hypothetical protein